MSAFTRLLPLAFGAALLGLAGCSPPAQDAVDPGNSPGAEPPPSASPASEGPALTGKVPIVIETSMGAIEAELDADKAPITVANFVAYANKGFYDGTVFHRVISDFMIQGGGFTEDLKEKPNDAPIQNEGQNGLHNEKGTLAMARTGDPNSATSQFFINVEDNTQKLDYPNPDGFGYAVFGKVTKGMDVVDKIKAVRTTNKQLTQITPGGQEMQLPADDVPVESVLIKSIKVVEAAGAPESGGPVAPAGDAGKAGSPGPGGY